jgi:hypothetical protein
VSAALLEREAGPVVCDDPCLGCGAAQACPLCDECSAAIGRAAEHTTACGCADCAVYARANAAAEVSL